jgi:hypothetical protein
MSQLTPILVALLSTDIKAAAVTAKRNTIWYSVAGIFMLGGFGSIVAAGIIYLSRVRDPAVASLIMAGLLLASALFVIAVLSVVSAYKKRHQPAIHSSKLLLTTAALTFAPLILGSRKTVGLAGAGALGFLAATYIRYRKTGNHLTPADKPKDA